MTIEELLKPRYKIIADFPACFYNIGRILTETKSNNYWDSIEAPSSIKIYKPERYPHLLKKLEWWEERPLTDLPNYVRFGELDKQHRFYKVDEWNKVKDVADLIEQYGPCAIVDVPRDYFISLRFSNNYPATKDEYENQIKADNNK